MRILSGIELALFIANNDLGLVEAAFNEIREQIEEMREQVEEILVETPAGVTLH